MRKIAEYDNVPTSAGLDLLIEDLAELYPGLIGIEAEIAVEQTGPENEHVTVAKMILHFEEQDDDDEYVDEPGESDLKRDHYDLWFVAQKLLSELGIDQHDGETFPDGVFWPEGLI